MWITAWDDHEVKDNYAGLAGGPDDGTDPTSRAQFARQRAAAYQAYYENLPIRANLRPSSASLKIYRRFDFGRPARINVLDTRQFSGAGCLPCRPRP